MILKHAIHEHRMLPLIYGTATVNHANFDQYLEGCRHNAITHSVMNLMATHSVKVCIPTGKDTSPAFN